MSDTAPDHFAALDAAREAAAAIPLETQLEGLCAELKRTQRLADRIQALPSDYPEKVMLVQFASTVAQIEASSNARLRQVRAESAATSDPKPA